MAQKLQDSFYEGWLYHFLVDPLLRRVHRLVHSQVKPGSTLIDIGCGTGELLFFLADVGSELVGVETSRRMWSFANRQARTRGFNNVQILFGDGAQLGSFSADFFDYAVACMALHEMDSSKRLPVLKEMKRLAQTLILVDYRVPPPVNFVATFCRFIERLAGGHHYRNYLSFTESGGLLPLLEKLSISVNKEITFYSHCLHLVLSSPDIS